MCSCYSFPLKCMYFLFIQIAGGTGVTPMLQIIEAILKNPDDNTKVDYWPSIFHIHKCLKFTGCTHHLCKEDTRLNVLMV